MCGFYIFAFTIVHIVYNAENSTNILKWNFIIYSISPLPHAVCSCSHVNKKQSQDLGLTAGLLVLVFFPKPLNCSLRERKIRRALGSACIFMLFIVVASQADYGMS